MRMWRAPPPSTLVVLTGCSAPAVVHEWTPTCGCRPREARILLLHLIGASPGGILVSALCTRCPTPAQHLLTFVRELQPL